jgi:general secretion pathway protein B
MSYILDALRRAQAQRERGSVPDIHALPQGAGAMLPAASRRLSPLVWGGIAAAVVAALLLAWWLSGQREVARDGPRDVVTLAPAVPMTPVAPPPAMPAPLQVDGSVPAAITVKPATKEPRALAPARRVAAATVPASAVPAATPASNAASKAPAPYVAKTPPATPAATPTPTTPTSAPPPAAQPAPAISEPRIYTREELPGDVRSQLPQIQISGSSYSQSPSSRMLIANGQVFYENEKIAPDTTLVQIRPNSAVLSFRGFRYAVPF